MEDPNLSFKRAGLEIMNMIKEIGRTTGRSEVNYKDVARALKMDPLLVWSIVGLLNHNRMVDADEDYNLSIPEFGNVVIDVWTLDLNGGEG